MSFSGSGFVRVNIPPLESPQGQVTMQLWMRPRVCDRFMSVVSQRVLRLNQSGHHTVHGRGIMISKNGQIHVWSRDGIGSFRSRQVGSCRVDTWTHISLLQQESKLQGYYNGYRTAEMEMGSRDNGTYVGYFMLGAFTDSGLNRYAFQGELDELRIWNRVIASDHIRCAMDTLISGKEPGLCAYYRFDEGCGDFTRDSTHKDGHSAHLLQLGNDSSSGLIWVKSSAPLFPLSRNCPEYAVNAAVACSPASCSSHGVCSAHQSDHPCACITGWVGSDCSSDNYAGYALAFNGGCDYLELPELSVMPSLTFELWVVFQRTRDLSTVVASRHPGLGRFSLHLMDEQLLLQIRGNVPEMIRFDVRFRADLWQHVAVTYDMHAKRCRLHIDGYLQQEVKLQETVAAVLSNSWVGGDPSVPRGQHFLKGQIDEVRIWDVARSRSHIHFAHSRRIPGPLPNLQQYYRLDEGYGSVAHDQSQFDQISYLGGHESTLCRPDWVVSNAPFRECPRNCYDRGDCVNGSCICSAMYTGLDCGTLLCPNGCSGHGDCVNGTCFCDAGFTGVDCSMLRCPSDCFGHGHCFNGSCICSSNYTGDDCSVKRCPRSCSFRGDCVDGTCRCDDGFAGFDCSLSDECPNRCHGNGVCIRGRCVCDPQWTGIDCSWNVLCINFCSGNGRCVDDKCVCDPGHMGVDCSGLSCPSDCSLRGDCVNGKCQCQEGYDGEDCSVRRTWPLKCVSLFANGQSAISCAHGDIVLPPIDPYPKPEIPTERPLPAPIVVTEQIIEPPPIITPEEKILKQLDPEPVVDPAVIPAIPTPTPPPPARPELPMTEEQVMANRVTVLHEPTPVPTPTPLPSQEGTLTYGPVYDYRLPPFALQVYQGAAPPPLPDQLSNQIGSSLYRDHNYWSRLPPSRFDSWYRVNENG
eukprot:GILJ01005845.1.p1 GENE.GILJ01005845.1~~GILJ01005845.1.p1  ORF type:complete len:1063 (-),score=95.43 GILJ01005845.1:184-2928(-)